MPPRFLERLERQSKAYREVFQGPEYLSEKAASLLGVDPPPYPPSRTSSTLSHANRSPKTLRSSIETQRTATTQQTSSTESSSTTQRTPRTPETPPPRYFSAFTLDDFPPCDIEKPALTPNSLVLVTGANGFLGSHVTDQLLRLGYRVRGTVRDQIKADWTTDYFRKKYGPHRYSASIVEDMVPKGAFDTAVQGCSGIIHCASVTNGSSDPTQVITPTIAGALNILESAARQEDQQIRRFVYTSATAAAVNSGRCGVRGDVNSDSWNMSSFFNAWKIPPYTKERAWEVYASSKLQTEQAVWRWYSEMRPDFVLNTVLPACLWGKMLVNPRHQGYPSSVGWLKDVWDGNADGIAAWVPPQYSIDVQDAALLHIAALTLPDVVDQRIFAAYTPWNIHSLLDLLRMLYPSRKFEEGSIKHGIDMTFFRELGLAEILLKRMGKEEGFRSLESSLARCIKGWTCNTRGSREGRNPLRTAAQTP